MRKNMQCETLCLNWLGCNTDLKLNNYFFWGHSVKTCKWVDFRGPTVTVYWQKLSK